MKKILLSLSACSLAFAAPMAVPTAASAAPATDVVSYCKLIIQYYPNESLGNCISFFRSDPNAAAAHFCGFIKNEGLLADFGFANMGDCVITLKNLL